LERGSPTRYPSSLAKTVSATFDSLRSTPAAAEIARLIAFLDEDSVPKTFLKRAISAPGTPILFQQGSSVDDPIALDEMTVPLFDYSLVRREQSLGAYRMHSLIRLVIRDLTPSEIRSRCEEATVNACSSEISDLDPFSRGIPLSESSVGLPCANVALRRHMVSPEAGRLLGKVGSRLLVVSQLRDAKQMLERSREIFIENFGVRHYELSRPLLWLALYASSILNEPAAAKLYEEVLDLSDPTTQLDVRAIAQNNLGEIYRNQGSFERAHDLLSQSLDSRKKLFGLNHPAVATALNNLGNLSGSIKEYKDAESFYHRAYEIRKSLFSPPNHYLANSLNNLGWVYLMLNRIDRAGKPLQEALAMWEALYGSQHPEVGITVSNLAIYYAKKGRAKKAAELVERAQKIDLELKKRAEQFRGQFETF